MENVFTPNIHPTLWYDNSSISDKNMGYVQFQNKVNILFSGKYLIF
jgi:hypothetical protein